MVNELIHPLSIDIQPPSLFNNPFRYTPHPLCLAAMNEVQRHLLSTPLYSEEIAMGKMFGVLVVKNQHDEIGFLAAFSGLLNGSNNLPYFVPAIYDILNPDGHFKQGERLLDEINRQIREMEGSETYIGLKKECEETMQEKDETLRAMKEAATTKKALRNKLRTESNLTAEEEQRLIKESQFEKAEIKRTRDTFNRKIAEMQRMIETTELQLNLLKKERKNLSDQLQRWIFDQYVVFNAKGESKKLTDIFDEETASLPPAGAGECAAPKLLQYAFLHNLSPLCMAEFWWGKSPAQQLRRHLNFYPACSGKCKPILHFMLQGLKVADSRNESPITTLSPSQTSLISETSPSTPNLPIIYEDDCLIVVNKPSGMLSVKGKGDTVSIEGVLAQRWGKDHIPYMVHRLDMDTSGLLNIAKDKKPCRRSSPTTRLQKDTRLSWKATSNPMKETSICHCDPTSWTVRGKWWTNYTGKRPSHTSRSS